MAKLKQTAQPVNLYDPLAGYPELLSTDDLAKFLNISYFTAWDWMQKLPHINVGMGKKNKRLRVCKQAVREQFNIPDPSNARKIDFMKEAYR